MEVGVPKLGIKKKPTAEIDQVDGISFKVYKIKKKNIQENI